MEPLRVLSYLAPSIPERLFELLAGALECGTGVPVRVAFETRVSGPSPDSDPFAADLADLAFVCAPSYPLLKDAGSPVELLPVAPVFADPRAEGEPVYFSDVIVRARHPAFCFEELRGAVWSYNDRASRSGWQNMLDKLAALGHARTPEEFFGNLLQAGSHLRSIALVAGGEADAAAIDSNTLWLARRRDPALGERLRVIESWGPMPIQPLLVRAGLEAPRKRRIADVLLSLDQDPALRAAVEPYGLGRFVRVEESAYSAIRPLGPSLLAPPVLHARRSGRPARARNPMPSAGPRR